MIENEKIEEMMMELEEKCDNSLNALERDYGSIRTGRANPHILDRLEVEAYGGMSKLIELGNFLQFFQSLHLSLMIFGCYLLRS